MSDAPPADVKEIQTLHKKKMTKEEMVDAKAKVLSNALKDHDSKFGKEIVAASNAYCTAKIGERRFVLAKKPCRISICNPQMEDEIKGMFRGLVADGLVMEANRELMGITNSLPRDKPTTGLHKAIIAVRDTLLDGKQALYRGHIYSLAEKAQFTYGPLDPVDVYINKILQYDHLAPILLGHAKPVIEILENAACSIINQLVIDYDLIEVNDGRCWKISTRKFIDMPYDESQLGIITPRMFCEFDSREEPKPEYFKTSILNSFPQPQQYSVFLNKWYQLLLHQGMPQKIPKLLTWGSRDSGKSTWVEPLRGIIPQRYFGALTKEKAFGTSMIDEDTQLPFVDEFVPEKYVSNDTAKALFQGGLFSNTKKYKTGRWHQNNSPYYICCQDEPYFGEDDGDVKRRLAIFKTKALQSTQSGVDLWLQQNAIHCIVWAGNVINANIHLVPVAELFYEPGRCHLPSTAPVNTLVNKDYHYEKIGEGKKRRLRESLPSKPLFRASQHIPSSTQDISTAVTLDDDDNMMTPPRLNRLCGNFSPMSAVCTPVPMATPCPTISSPSISDFSSNEADSDDSILSSDQNSSGDIPKQGANQEEPIIDSQDENGLMAREVYRLLQSNMAGNANRESLLSHISKYMKFGTRKFPKIDAEFNAYCFIRGRFVGDFDPTVMFRYFKKDLVQTHVERIRKILKL